MYDTSPVGAGTGTILACLLGGGWREREREREGEEPDYDKEYTTCYVEMAYVGLYV